MDTLTGTPGSGRRSEDDQTLNGWAPVGTREDAHADRPDGGPNGYQLGARLSMDGEVYEGINSQVPGRFAIKLFPRSVGEATATIDAFSREAGRVSILRHPHIAQVIDSGALGDRTPFLAMERLFGCTLAERLSTATEPMPLDQVRALVRGLALGLSVAHAAGVVHRELRPDNVFLDCRGGREPGQVKLLDFGVSRLTWGNVRAGQGIDPAAAPYLAPEQRDGEIAAMDERTDQFALAALTWRLLNGAPAEPEAVSVRGGAAVDIVLQRALSERPADRYPSLPAFFDELDDALGHYASLLDSAHEAGRGDLAPQMRSAPPTDRFFMEGGERREARGFRDSTLSFDGIKIDGGADLAELDFAPLVRGRRAESRPVWLLGIAAVALMTAAVALAGVGEYGSRGLHAPRFPRVWRRAVGVAMYTLGTTANPVQPTLTGTSSARAADSVAVPPAAVPPAAVPPPASPPQGAGPPASPAAGEGAPAGPATATAKVVPSPPPEPRSEIRRVSPAPARRPGLASRARGGSQARHRKVVVAPAPAHREAPSSALRGLVPAPASDQPVDLLPPEGPDPVDPYKRP